MTAAGEDLTLTAPVLIPLIAAAVTATAALVGVWINGVRQERRRRRELYARALAVTFDYREFAYAVRRRQAAMPVEERVRLSDALRAVQRDVDQHRALLSLERSNQVAERYEALVLKTREVAGEYMRESWASGGGVDSDPEMNVPDLDMGPIDSAVERFKDAVRQDLAWWKA